MSTTTKKLKQDKMIQEENEQKVEKKLKQKKKKKSHQNHHHILKKYTDNHTLIQKQEKKQRQKQKIQHNNNKKDKNQDKHNINNKQQISQSNDLTSSKQQQQISKQQKQSIDPIQHQLSLLAFTQQLTPSIQACQLINSHLQRLTINLYEKMIMKTSLISESIELAKKQLLTPKQYFAINYTNKLLLIKELLTHNGQVKYNKWIQFIDIEVDRVQKLILRCIDDVDIFNQVLTDLKKLNNQWEIKPKYIITHIL